MRELTYGFLYSRQCKWPTGQSFDRWKIKYYLYKINGIAKNADSVRGYSIKWIGITDDDNDIKIFIKFFDLPFIWYVMNTFMKEIMLFNFEWINSIIISRMERRITNPNNQPIFSNIPFKVAEKSHGNPRYYFSKYYYVIQSENIFSYPTFDISNIKHL